MFFTYPAFAILASMTSHTNKPIFKFNKGRDSVFLLFLIGTFIFWFLNQLSKNYNQVVDYTVVYEDLPNQFVFQDNPKKTIAVRIKASGFYFFSNALKNKKTTISLKNIEQRTNYVYQLSNAELKKQVRATINDRISVIEVLDDVLEVHLGKRSFKKVKVIPNIAIDYHLGYNSFSGIQITPDSIEVSGPELQLAKIQTLSLEAFEKKNVMSPIHQKIAIQKVDLPKIKYHQNKVNLDVSVEKITEKTLSIPIQIINAPNTNIVIYPKKAKVTFQVLLSEFNKIHKEDFVLIADYNQKGSKHLKLKLANTPKKIAGVKLDINQVEYLILK